MMTSKKAPGFYAGMLACVLAIAAAVCYGVVFPRHRVQGAGI